MIMVKEVVEVPVVVVFGPELMSLESTFGQAGTLFSSGSLIEMY